jgi:hypothetical protein
MLQILRTVWFALLSLSLCLPPPAAAQPADLSKTALERLADLQSAAEQFAEQQGQFAGRTVGPKLASVTNQLQQVLLNFDVWTCGSAVTALGLKHKQIAMEALRADPPDPALDRAMVDLGNLIAQLQELCNKHVFDAGLAPTPTAVAAGSDGAPAPTPAPEPPALSVQERICYSRCRDLYVAYLQAEREYNAARRAAESARAAATGERAKANTAAARARTAQETADKTQSDHARLQAALTATTNQAERLRLADQLAHLHPDTARSDAAKAQQAADQANTKAREAEETATRRETQASMLYDALVSIHEALQRCARECADQAKLINQVDLDWEGLFVLAPGAVPERPPFYRPRPVPPASRAPAQPPRTALRVVATPMALSGGMLSGAVYDGEGQPKENARVALTQHDGSKTEARTDASGRFALTVASGTGSVALALPGTDAKPSKLQVVETVPASMIATPGEFVELGSQLVLGKPYRAAFVTGASGVELELPTGTSLAPDGATGLTSIGMPFALGTGALTVRLIGMDGTETTAKTGAYGFLEAWLEQEKLRSGQNAAFGYEIDFGDGPMTITMTIATTGPIVYDRVGQPQVVQVGADGRMSFRGSIHALQGSPVGIPFTIVPTFSHKPPSSEAVQAE